MIAIDRLIACALGEDDDEVEAHVLECDECAARFAQLASLPAALRDLVHDGHMQVVATRGLVDRLDAAGLVTRRYVLAPGATVPCTVDSRDVYTVVVLEADLATATRVDVVRGTLRYEDVPFDPAHGRVYVIAPAVATRSLPTAPIPLRVVAVDAAGDRTLGEYTLDHARSG
ncbi:MAG: hypothetical protein ACM31C_21445 [Acidobacteriota bacterium]